MKALFNWTPLEPPTDSAYLATHVAHQAAVVAVAMTVSMLLLGLDQGPWIHIPLIASIFLFGLPHGAIDHLVFLGLAKKKMNAGTLTLTCLFYISAVLAFLILWWMSPILGILLFLLITIYHWGKADVAFEELTRPFGGRKPSRGSLPCGHLMLRGILPIGVPFVAFPEEVEAFILACTLSFGEAVYLRPELGRAILIVISLLFVAEIFYLRQAGAKWKQYAIEDIGLLLYFSVVQPILAIGVYFCFWHGFRHTLRLMHYTSFEQGFRVRSFLPMLVTFYIRAIPFTLAALLLMMGVLLILPETGASNRLLAIYLVVISSLTLPHLIVVEWMDRRERL